MSDEQRWDAFIAWARRFYDWPDFDESERAYKRVVADRLHAALEALRAGSDDDFWLERLRVAIENHPNNLTHWRVNAAFMRWCQRQPRAARVALQHLWLGPESLDARVRRFMEEVPEAAVASQHGMFASFLLLALGVETHPMYRDRAYHIACRMTGYPEGPTQDSGAIYAHAVGFVDAVLAEARTRGLQLRDRLDAQSLLWCVTWSKPTDPPVSGWPVSDRNALVAYREAHRWARSGAQPPNHTAHDDVDNDASDTGDTADTADSEVDNEDSAEAGADQQAAVWMFQFNPENWSLERHLQEVGPIEWWRAQQFRSRMHIGQRVYFLRSGGRSGGDHAALVAIGRLVSTSYAEETQEHGFRVAVLFEALVEPPLTREAMRAIPEFASYRPYAVGVFNTNFILPREVAARTAAELQGRLIPLPQPLDNPNPAAQDLNRDARNRVIATIVRRQGQAEFRQQLLVAYGNRCSVTGCDAVDALEAAHILPYRGAHTNHVTNGLLLRADIHSLFDLGLLAVDTAAMTLVLAPELARTTYAELAGRRLHLPEDIHLHPDVAALNEHRVKLQW